MIYVDSNIILDVLRVDPVWMRWSEARLGEARSESSLVTGTIVVAEISHYLHSADQVRSILDRLSIFMVPEDVSAAFLAGQAYREYRRRGGERPSLLPDFLIGGHAMALGATILTRDARRYRSYFPEVSLITPEESE